MSLQIGDAFSWLHCHAFYVMHAGYYFLLLIRTFAKITAWCSTYQMIDPAIHSAVLPVYFLVLLFEQKPGGLDKLVYC